MHQVKDQGLEKGQAEESHPGVGLEWTSSQLRQWSPGGTGAVAFLAPLPTLHEGSGTEWASRFSSRNKEAVAAAAKRVGKPRARARSPSAGRPPNTHTQPRARYARPRLPFHLVYLPASAARPASCARLPTLPLLARMR